MSQRNHQDNRKYFEVNEDEDTTYQNVWGAVKVELKG